MGWHKRLTECVELLSEEGFDVSKSPITDVVAARDLIVKLLTACEAALAYISACVEPSCDEGDELEDGTIHDGSTHEGNLLRAAIADAKGGE